MLLAFWIQVNTGVQQALVVLYVQKRTFHDIHNQDTDDSSQLKSAKRKQSTNDALIGPGFVLPRTKKSRLH
jgi:hypothetical protein